MSSLGNRLNRAESLERELNRPPDDVLFAAATSAALAIFSADEDADVGLMMAPDGPLAREFGAAAAVVGTIRAIGLTGQGVAS